MGKRDSSGIKSRRLQWTVGMMAAFTLLPFFVQSQNADIELLKAINLNRNRELDPFFRGITHTAGPVAFVVPLLILFYAIYIKNNLLKKRATFLIISVATAVIITTSLKYTIQRPRPFETYTFIEKVTSGGSPSFPSGHTTDAFVIATALSLAFPRKWIVIPFYLWAMAIAYSRMGLGVHYPVDVLVGIIIGSGASLGWYFYLRKNMT